MQIISIMRSGSLLADIKPSKNSTQVKRVMGENVLNISFEDYRFIPFQIGDYCTVFGEVYKINQTPTDIKKSTRFYEYTLRMEAEMYDLAKCVFMFYGSDNTLTEPFFSLMGNAQTFVDLVLENMLRIDSGWKKGEVMPTEYRPLTFQAMSCHEALMYAAQEFGIELWVEGKTIHLTKVQRDTGRQFMQGQNRGLYEITRRNMDNSHIATRLLVFGGDQNLPQGYGSTRLRLPEIGTSGSSYLVNNVSWIVTGNGDGTSTISFSFLPPAQPDIVALGIHYTTAGGFQLSNHGGNSSPRTIRVPTADWYDIRFSTVLASGTTYTTMPFRVTFGSGLSLDIPGARIPYLQKNTDKYGVIEYVAEYPEIYPRRTGKITNVDQANIYRFYDQTLDFNLNFYKIQGLAPKITFNTGQLAGYTFDIALYENGSRAITVLKNKDERSIDVPSPTFRVAVGDEYVLTDIIMPPEYVDKAEAELMVKAQLLLDVVSQPQLSYGLAFDEALLPRRGYIPRTGDLIWIKDDELSVNRKIRIVTTTRNIVDENHIDAELADTIQPGTIQRMVAVGAGNSRDIQNIEDFIRNRDVFNGKLQLPVITDTSGYTQVFINTQTGELARLG